MKKYTKIVAGAVAALAIFVTTNVNAQSEPTNPSRQKLGVGINAGIPTNDGSSFALGADLRYQVDIDRQLSIPITAGFTSIFHKDSYGGGSFGYIPAKAGLKYFFSDTGSGAYGLAEAGAAFSTNTNGGTWFTYSPAIGYAWSNGLDLGVKYEGLTKSSVNTGYVGLRLAYGFKL